MVIEYDRLSDFAKVQLNGFYFNNVCLFFLFCLV